MREREENCVASTSRDDPAGARNCAPRKIWSDAPPRPHRPAKATLADRIEEKLDRRDKDILRYLEAHRGRYVSCRELLSLNYGIFDAGMSIEELILKIFKIRRFLNARLGLDPISFDSEFRFVFTDMAKEECAKLMGAIAI